MAKNKGLLFPVYSLPGKYGIGDFGKEAYKLVDIIKEAGFDYWQLLPLNPISYGHSPYMAFSSYAIEELYVSLDDLVDRGYLKRKPSSLECTNKVDYEKALEFKSPYYKKAYDKFISEGGYEVLDEFTSDFPEILEYARFVSRKELFNHAPWNTWVEIKTLKYQERVNYHLFLQYILLDEWNKLHEYCNKKGIKVIGDVPFYVGYDSAEVFYNREDFLLDEKGNSTFVAGVAPDVFSDLGQRWGNPIYNFEHMKKNGYKLIIDRLLYASELYDIVRIDHFRAFDTYYVIPAQYEDARIGEWKLGPAYDLFDKLFEQAPDIKIIAEDLGDLRPEVLELRDHYNLPGMNILEFTIWDWMKDKEGYKKTLKPNCIGYIGTHDNETVNGWLSNRTPEEISRMNEFFGHPESIEDAMIKFGLDNFETFIIAAQDVLHLPAETRINTPSTVNDVNWTYRFKTLDDLAKALKKDIYR